MCPRDPGKVTGEIEIKIIIRCLFILSCALTVASASEVTSLESEIELLKAGMEQFKSYIVDLQQKIAKMENERVLESSLFAFDCYRTSGLSTEGIITFNGCSVDTTTSDPWTGIFTVQNPGIYRLTFMGRVYLPYGNNGGYTGEGDILIDGDIVASARVLNGYYQDYDSISINTLQELNAGQLISVKWGGTGILDAGSNHVHFTGEYVASSTVAPPECEYTGQTFEYPGSCRKYYLCLADGTVELNNCCPDVFDPIGETCISEDDGGYLCNDEDTC